MAFLQAFLLTPVPLKPTALAKKTFFLLERPTNSAAHFLFTLKTPKRGPLLKIDAFASGVEKAKEEKRRQPNRNNFFIINLL